MPGEVSRHEETPEVLQGEVMESIIIEKDLQDWHEACVFELDGHLYLASMGRRELLRAYMGLISGASPTVWVAYVHKGKFDADIQEQLFVGDANSLNHLIYLFEQDCRGDGPEGRQSYNYYSQGRGYEDFTATWRSTPSDPVGFGAGIVGKVVEVELKDGKVVKVELGSDTIIE